MLLVVDVACLVEDNLPQLGRQLDLSTLGARRGHAGSRSMVERRSLHSLGFIRP